MNCYFSLEFNVPKSIKYVREHVRLSSSKADENDGRYSTLSCSGFQISDRYVITSRECCEGDVEVKVNDKFDPIPRNKLLVDDNKYPQFCLIEFDPLFTLKNIKPCLKETFELTSPCWSFAQDRFYLTPRK